MRKGHTSMDSSPHFRRPPGPSLKRGLVEALPHDPLTILHLSKPKGRNRET